MIGCIDPSTKSWSDGALVKCIRNAQTIQNASEVLETTGKSQAQNNHSGKYHQWIVLDGALDHGCADQINCLLDDGRTLCLASGEILSFTGKHKKKTF